MEAVNAPVPAGYATGLIPRDYSAVPVGSMVFAPEFPSSELIDQSEWADRLEENRRTRSGLLDVREDNYETLRSLNQGQLGLCHTPDTEVLTEKGWVAWPDYNYTDLLGTVNTATGAMEFQAPFEKHVYPYQGEMVYSTNRRLKFGVTPDHRMLLRKWDESKRTLSDQYTFQRAGDIGWYAGFMAAPQGWRGTEILEVEVPGDRRYSGDDFVAMLALIVSDGFAGDPFKKTKNLVSFAAFRPDRRESTAALAHRIGFKESPSRSGVWNRWSADALADWVRTNCYTSPELGAKNKRIPDIIKSLSRRQIELFIDFFGDRSYDKKSEQYYSTSKRMVDDLQELLLRIGRRSTLSLSAEKYGMMPQGTVCKSSPLWTLTASDTGRLCVERKKHIERESFKGEVYCAAVPNGTLITRHNGSVLISGNCWAFSSTKATMYVRALMGEPLVRLSAWWVAGKVVGWRDQGYWGAASLAQIVKEGVPVESLCPSYSSRYDTSETRADAAKRKVTEWWDGSEDPREAQKQLVSMLLKRIPCVVDLNDMGHSMCAIDIKSLNPLTIVYDNSWGDQGDKGLYYGTGARARPDGLVIPRVAMAA